MALNGSLGLYFRIIQEGFAVRSHYDLLKWLQGDVQCFLPHHIMLALWIGPNANQAEYDVISVLPGIRTGFLTAETLLSLQRELYGLWLTSGGAPTRQQLDRSQTSAQSERLPPTVCKIFQGMRSLLIHGFRDKRTNQDCLYLMFHSQRYFDDAELIFLEEFLPYLDNALRRVMPMLHAQDLSLTRFESPHNCNPSGLSKREAEILDWVRFGKTNSEIADILGISISTVKNHLQNIFKKLDVFNRMQAIAKIGQMTAIKDQTRLRSQLLLEGTSGQSTNPYRTVSKTMPLILNET
ncbi:XrtB/PEP-CTERM-associated transcriptional regulator EpsA [Nitrosomonas sp. sh817]|uniref:XrtB/PEP-CTERM-associated transcriptional regulator EpsA n=1 Tax=Nitrosomonas sp. sh817 TaxID=3070658 RepID=UPI0027DB1972|nr:XrtB/PEP-CTERM-associated transcriptional regulator EpsA [Nitrosomonas sp. sh817]WMJ08311.1 LuxR C-terminal-related transcriptional regulator [Nitrosomonas sp. sh817]